MRYLRSTWAVVALGCSLLACDRDAAVKPTTTAPSQAGSAPVASGSSAPAANAPVLAEYTLRGIPFAYFQIPAGLSREELIAAAQALHAQQPKAQLVLVDDASKVNEYVTYVKAISGQGELKDPPPQEWADKHIIANVQLYLSGKFVLCEGNGSKEIAELQ